MFQKVNINYDTSQNKNFNIVIRANARFLTASQGIVFETHRGGCISGKSNFRFVVPLGVASVPTKWDDDFERRLGQKRISVSPCFSYPYEKINREKVLV